MRSSVNGTCGSMAMIDLVRKSSGVIMGVVRDEKDLAAALTAFNEAVKFDLNANFRCGNPTSTAFLLSCFSCGLSKTLKSNSSKPRPAVDNGSSNTGSPGGDINGIRRLRGDLLPREVGVTSELQEIEDSLKELSSREGMDSLDIVLEDRIDSLPFSLPIGSSSNSSGELSRKSNGLRPRDMLNSFSETSVFSIIESTVNLGAAPLLFRTLLLSFCGGIEVIASSAATDGGIASGE